MMGPTRWGVIIMLLGKPAAAGVCIPWAPWPPTQPPTIVNAPPQLVNTADMVQHTFDEALTQLEKSGLQALLEVYADCFATGTTTGRTNVVTHHIDTGNADPIKQRPH